ncbi:MAG TPA: hypothetical protein VGC39_02350 [Candidatus Methylacidiphilales bacterium]
MRYLLFVFAVGSAVFAAGILSGRAVGQLDRTTNGQDVAVALTSPFADFPPGGCVPYKVNIRNDRTAPGTWHLLFQGEANGSTVGATVFEKDLSVAPNSSASFDLVVPVPVVTETGNTTLNVGVTGPGFGNSHGQFFAYIFSNTGNSRSAFAVIGAGVLGSIGSGPLESAYKDRSAAFYGSVVDPEALPSDWRAYSGVAILILKDNEWLGLSASQRESVRDYVSQGGHLTLFTSENPDLRTPELQLPTTDGKPGVYGFGTISLETTPSFPPDPSTLITVLDRNPASNAGNVDQSFSTWALRPMVGAIVVSAGFILSFVLLFGSLVGPINLFVFARGKHRFRLFWTTPLISLLASLALIVGILLTDGLGGKGVQMVAIYSLPAVNREVVIQEQVARTAVLFSNQWHSDQNYLITPVSDNAMKNALAADGGRTSGLRTTLGYSPDTYRQDGNEYFGNWFRSRSVCGQYLQAVRPSRSALTVLNPQALPSPGVAPVVLSSFPEELSQVFVVDNQGRYWTCSHLQPGRKETCTPSTEADFNPFWDKACADAGGKLRPFLSRVRDRAGCFYATGLPSSDERLATLNEIRWRVDQGIYLGQWVASTAPENNL